MTHPPLTFAIPTYRLRDVGETVEQHDQHFWRNGHAVPIVVFDAASTCGAVRIVSRTARGSG